jgi:DNA polymerase-1
MSKQNKRPIIIIDGMNLFIRYFMAIESVNSRSEPIGGVVGFVRFIDFIISRFAPGKVIVVWENGGASPRRRAICSSYKANRAKIKEFKSRKSGSATIKDLLREDTENKVSQLSLLYKLLKKTPVCQIFIKDTEADDIIGYLAKYSFVNEDRLKMIVSSDKDFYQLLDDPNVKIYDPARKITLDHNYVKEKFNITANNFCLARTFVGDPSDNIEGVPGVGLKTLSKRFPGFSEKDTEMTIGRVLEECTNLLKAKATKKLKSPREIIQCEDTIRRNWKLMYLNSSNLSASQIAKISGTLEQHENKFDKLGLIKEITKAGMNMSFDFEKFSSNARRYLVFD